MIFVLLPVGFAVPSASHCWYVILVIAGGLYAATDIVVDLLAVRPRESPTVVVIVNEPDLLMVLD